MVFCVYVALGRYIQRVILLINTRWCTCTAAGAKWGEPLKRGRSKIAELGSSVMFSVRLNPEPIYRGVNSTLPGFVHKLHIQSHQAFSWCQCVVLFGIRCTNGGAPHESVEPALKHLPRDLRDNPVLLVLTSEQWSSELEKIRPTALVEQGERHQR